MNYIDLNIKDRKSVNVEPMWSIDIKKKLYESKTKGLFGKIFGFLQKRRHIEKVVSVSIDNVVVPAELVCDKTKIFTIAYPQDDVDKLEYSMNELPIDVHLKSEKVPFSVFFHPKEILDCTQEQGMDDPIFPIKFDVVISDPADNNKEIHRLSECVHVKFVGMRNVPEIRINPVEDGEIQYSTKGAAKFKVAKMYIKLPNTFKRAPSVDLKIELKVTDENGREVQDLITSRREFYYEKCRTKVNSNGKAQPFDQIDIAFDFHKIVNPIAPEALYTIKANAFYKNSADKDGSFQPLHVDLTPITVLQDRQGTELVVNFTRSWNTAGETKAEERTIDTDVKSDSTVTIPVINFTSKSLIKPVKVKLANKASDTSRSNAGLTIRNLKVRTSLLNPTHFIQNRSFAFIDADTIVATQNVDSALETHQGLFIPNGEAQYTEFTINFNPKNIFMLRDESKSIFSIGLVSVLEFDYKEDILGNGDVAFKHYKTHIEWSLHQDPNPEWLGIDYGSSAIVCYYGSGDKGNIIDLRTAREQVFKGAIKSQRNPSGISPEDAKDKLEQSTPFLPSDILFNDTGNDNQESVSLVSQLSGNEILFYNQVSVMLSPTDNLVVKNFRRQLPCLKILMGNEYLPEKADYSEYSYNIKDEGGNVVRVKAEDHKDKSYSLLRIDSVFNEAYHTLFHYFIANENIVMQTNQVVLTYPNTYTPRNLNVLKGIVQRLLPNARNVEFISESDAVAAYYMAHWNDYHINGDIEKDENILVYDMGAGTLDVTYLTKCYRNGKYILEIKGKIGTGRAGNYLDYVIAQILSEILPPSQFKKQWANTNMQGVQQDVMASRVKLKSVIKEIIKPALNKNDDIKFSIDGSIEITLNPERIIQHPKFKEFLNQCTTNIWGKLKKYVGAKDFKVDTVIMSGRSMRLEVLQRSLKYLVNNASFIMLDNIVNGPNKGKPCSRSKTAVVEGAKICVETYMNANTNVEIKSRRLQASYGVAFKRTGGRWDYVELLDRENIPFRSENANAFRRKNGNVTIHGANESDVLRFIQSYMSEDDTKEALNKNDLEFISEMGEVLMADLGHESVLDVNVSVDRDNNVSLEVNGGITEGRTPRGVDLQDTITRNSLWPISIEDKEKKA